MKNSFKDSLNDIYQSILFSQEFTKNLNETDFLNDAKTQFAVIRCIEVIGEAVKRLPDDFRSTHPEVPWKAMAGMRDRLIHGYDVVDNEVIWNTVTHDFPFLLDRLKEIMNL